MGCGCGKRISVGESPYSAQVKARRERLQQIAKKSAESEASKQRDSV